MTLTLPSPQPHLTALVGIAPERTRHVSQDSVLQRLNYVPGRTLTETAVETEQAWVEARLGIAGRRLSPGIVEGLAIGLGDQDATPGTVTLSAGHGIAPRGQDVQVLKPTSFVIDQLQQIPVGGAPAATPRGLVVVLLEPIVVESERLPADASRLHAFADTCPPDATTAPYLDFVLQDAARLGWIVLDPALAGADPARAPNVAAEAIRSMEAADPGALPWAELGVPLTLLSIADDGRIAWQHRAAVARRGGMLPRPQLRPLARLRQSRVEGLIEETAMATRRAAWDGTAASAFLRFLPPAGLLPRKAWTGHRFFPDAWGEAEAPIPLSQLDAALDAAAALAPFDLDAPEDKVKWLVPVPDQFYAPDLLQPLQDPDFASVTAILQSRVADTLSLRTDYRVQAPQVQGTLDAAAVSDFALAEDDPVSGEDGFPPDDPQPAEDFAAGALAVLREVHDGLDPLLFLAAQRDMVDPAQLQAAIGAPGTPFGLTPFVTGLRTLVDNGNDRIDFAFNRVQAEIYRVRQITLDNEEATKLATFPTLAGIAKGNNSYALSEGLKAHFLAQKTTGPERVTGDGTPGLTQFSAGARTAAERDGLMFDAGIIPRATLGLAAAPPAFDPGAAAIAGAGLATAPREAVFDVKGTTALTSFGNNAASLSFGTFLSEGAFAVAPNTTLVKDLVDATRAELVDDVILSDAVSKKSGILWAVPLPGDIREVRTTTIADRLATSAALNAKASAVRIKADILRQIQELGLSLEGLDGPLTSSRDRVLLPKAEIDRVIAAELTQDEFQQLEQQINRLRQPLADSGDSQDWEMMALPEAEFQTSGQVGVTPLTRLSMALRRRNAPVAMPLLPALTLSKALDPDPTAGGRDADGDDESAYLSAAIGTLESAIAILRVVEARVGAIMAAVETVEAQTKRAADFAARWQAALTLADQDLDEARHDLRVGQSLIDEERVRLEALRAERSRILREEVKFVAYTRPRALTAHSAGDTLGLMLPGAFEDPLPATLRHPVKLPEELGAMIAALREMPLLWLASNPEFSGEFTAPVYLSTLYAGVRYRAETQLKRLQALPLAKVPGAGGSPAKLQAARIAGAYRSLTTSVLAARATLDLAAFDAASWADKQRRALSDLSLNDLIEAGTQPRVTKLAAAEIEDIERVAHGLLELVRQVPAPIRLLWTRELSAYDDVASLSRLSRLPAWSRLDYGGRSRMERLNGWLFSRMERDIPEAEGLMTDLVRVVILIASHAPVAEIVAARIADDQSVTKGGAVDIVIRRGTPSIGMHVAFSTASAVLARGIVRDLYGGRAKVEVTYAAQPLLSLTPQHQVAVFAPATLARTRA
jgi:HAMP domain-containing protein